ncbi:Copper chaperone CopZ [Amycolatopsis xylanica]|uniref:Copper chaperone CopZ n=2 Tax=Amycolatopsis xylanica TaxID=589385 RepID=A0A1H3T301_9PSEU|nr:Copper chaperone CopZ [Amycolatopsis xylanica]
MLVAMTSSYTVTGMSCGGCAGSVSRALNALTGVSDVKIDLKTGQVTVDSAEPVAEPDIRAAIEKAGYQLA